MARKVAVTVILAAVIAAFVFGMSGSISKSHIVAATGQINATNPGNVDITYQGGQDAKQVMGLNVSFNGGSPTASFSPIPASGAPVAVGATATGTKGHTVVTAYFSDGSSSVILDSNY